MQELANQIKEKLLQEIGCQVETINDNLEGCSRGPDPTSDKLTELVSKTKNIGFAFDLDSDRVILVMNGEKKSSGKQVPSWINCFGSNSYLSIGKRWFLGRGRT